jgi:hypothetical protein
MHDGHDLGRDALYKKTTPDAGKQANAAQKKLPFR